jgi:hypothetical protein
MQRINRRSFLFLVPVAALLSSCADFWVEKDGGVVSGCVDTAKEDRCDTEPSKAPQSAPPGAAGLQRPVHPGWVLLPYDFRFDYEPYLSGRPTARG